MTRRSTRPCFRTGVAAVVALASAVVGAVAAAPAGADCSSPSIVFAPTEVGRGQQVQVTGSGWGTACYDTGPPPAGVGPLGAPIPGAEIVLTQGSNEWLLGTAVPGEDYTFSLAVAVPTAAEPGEAELRARAVRSTGFIDSPTPTLTITDAAPVDPPPSTTSSLEAGPAGVAAEDLDSVVEDGNSSLPLILGGVGVAIAALVVGWWVLRARRS